MATAYASGDSLAELGARLDDWVERGDILEIHATLSGEMESLRGMVRARVQMLTVQRAEAQIARMQTHLEWVDMHRGFALPFELVRELDYARTCAVEAHALLEPAALVARS
ncbi:MAG TPA: hypothetical protein VF221_17835 [Chloroflexota bacterium]